MDKFKIRKENKKWNLYYGEGPGHYDFYSWTNARDYMLFLIAFKREHEKCIIPVEEARRLLGINSESI